MKPSPMRQAYVSAWILLLALLPSRAVFAAACPTCVADPCIGDWSVTSSGLRPYYGEGGVMAPVGPAGVLFFGGGVVLQRETWSWDGASWTQLFPGVAPSARIDPSMAYVGPSNGTGHNVLLFGGLDPGNSNFDDTWLWDQSTKQWNEIITSPTPPARSQACMADMGNGNVLLFGGEGDLGSLSDTWIWSAATNQWTNNPITPGGHCAGMSYAGLDPGSGHHRVALMTVSGTGPNITNNVWIFDVDPSDPNGTTGTWYGVTPLGSSPSARWRAGLAYNAADQSPVLVGGEDSSTFLHDAWQLKLDPFPSWVVLSTYGPSPNDEESIAENKSNGTIIFRGDQYDPPTWIWKDTGLVAWYQSNPIDSARHHDGTLIGNPTLDDTLPGLACNWPIFDGSTDYISVPDDPTLRFNSGSGMSITAWIRTTKPTVDPMMIVFKNSATGPPSSGYALGVDSGGLLSFTSQSSGSFPGVQPTITDGVWHHVGVAVSPSGMARFFVDGTASTTQVNVGAIQSYSGPLLIGTQIITGLPVSLFDGSMGAIQLFNRELSQADVLACSALSSCPFPWFPYDPIGIRIGRSVGVYPHLELFSSSTGRTSVGLAGC